jgi:cytochrome c oxidase subunit 1
LEWATSSPPPAYNFLHVPVVRASSDPLWDENEIRPAAAGLAFDEREVLVTTVLDAEPDHRMKLPTPSIWPLLTALATTLLLIGTIFTPWAVVWGTPPVVVAMIGWFWPRKASTEARA